MVAPIITYTKVRSRIHATGASIKTSRRVPPPKAVTIAMIKIPKISSFLFIAVKAPDTAKAMVPKMSIIKNKLTCSGYSSYSLLKLYQ